MPGLFEQFPHTNLHELNLDWIIDMLNQFKEELENSAVLSVNGETGHVTLYESENVILPALPEGVDQWRLVRLVDGQYAGILFYNGNAYIQHGDATMRLLTQEDIPSSSGVVSWNGLTGVVNVTGQDIPVDDTADADSIAQAITTEHTERVNADNELSTEIDTLDTNMGGIGRVGAKIPWYYAMADKAIPGNSTTEINVTNSTKALLIIVSAAQESMACCLVSASSQGVVNIQEISKGANVTFDTSTANKLKVTLSTASTAYGYAMIFDGNGMS